MGKSRGVLVSRGTPRLNHLEARPEGATSWCYLSVPAKNPCHNLKRADLRVNGSPAGEHIVERRSSGARRRPVSFRELGNDDARALFGLAAEARERIGNATRRAFSIMAFERCRSHVSRSTSSPSPRRMQPAAPASPAIGEPRDHSSSLETNGGQLLRFFGDGLVRTRRNMGSILHTHVEGRGYLRSIHGRPW